jgi:hypothetical protein
VQQGIIQIEKFEVSQNLKGTIENRLVIMQIDK